MLRHLGEQGEYSQNAEYEHISEFEEFIYKIFHLSCLE